MWPAGRDFLTTDVNTRKTEDSGCAALQGKFGSKQDEAQAAGTETLNFPGL